ncbi:DsbA family protein [Candidatus Micrarchaeota archaeon]|nr:DsbA family protein [Candidatus Micrarchaeota archaeon]MBU1165417.1 DsbA family protein [Candidatus Micrarchaeota archaeon]MBU1886964.1 DsbA family protein [Candidatus Micrarchaeota archaeon]
MDGFNSGKKVWLFGIFAVIVLAVVAYTVFGGVSDTDNTYIQNQDQNPDPDQLVPKFDPYAEMVDDDPVKGNPNALVTIVEFSDFECPFCGRYFDETYPRINDEYIKTGKVRYVFRDFPLGFHQYAQKASEAAQCANDQGKFWEMHDILFENRNDLGITNLKTYARNIGLDVNEFDQCLDSGKYYNEVQADLLAGQEYGITGTPAFLINGNLVVGAQPYSVFKNVIDFELDKAQSQ